MNLISIPVFQSNYIWILSENDGHCTIIDPGEITPVLAAIEESQWRPKTILLTHHHQNHVGGVKRLREKFPSIVVYGPAETQDKGVTQVVGNNGWLSTLGRDSSISSTPGHTLGHICYYSGPYPFCGNTTFPGGYERFFEGTAKQMYQSFMKINALPEKIPICCAYGYTSASIKFALGTLPDDRDISDYYHRVNELRTKKQKALPVTLKNERRINLLLCVNDISLVDKINQETNLQYSVARFAWLRSKKDNF